MPPRMRPSWSASISNCCRRCSTRSRLSAATVIHDRYGTNLIGAFTVGKGDAEGAFKRAPRRLKRRFHHHRYAAMPMECRGVVGLHDPRTDSVTIWSATQVVHWLRREAATVLKLPEARIRCLALDVGGGFGVKGHVYPEDLLVPYLARRSNRRAVDRGPPRASALLVPFARSDPRCGSRLRRHRPHRGAARSLHCRLWSLESDRAPASSTTPPCICPAPTRSMPSPSRPASPPPTKRRTRRIAAPAVRKPPSQWSAALIWSPPSSVLSPPRFVCATYPRRRNAVCDGHAVSRRPAHRL